MFKIPFGPHGHLCRLGATALGFIVLGRGLEGSDFVTVRAWADSEYTARRAEAGDSKNETYVAAVGEYFDGWCRDPSVGKSSFGAILHFLAPTLTKQRYYPAADPMAADLLLVVHWGTTIGRVSTYVPGIGSSGNSPEFRPYDSVQQSMDSGLLEVRSAANALEQQYDTAQTIQSVNEAARAITANTAEGLLGYAKQLARERNRLVSSDVQRTLEANLQEDRYFVILQAYDFQKLRRKEGRKLLWSAHMSMRSPGLNFTLALPRMGDVASSLYGQNNDDVVTGESLAHQRASVEIGPITILSDAPPADRKK